MKKKYKLGDYVEYYTTFCKIGNKIEYTDKTEGFIYAISERMQEDSEDVIISYTIGPYIGGEGYVVREAAIIRKLKAPRNKSRLEYLKAKVKRNELNVKHLLNDNKLLREEIKRLEQRESELHVRVHPNIAEEIE